MAYGGGCGLTINLCFKRLSEKTPASQNWKCTHQLTPKCMFVFAGEHSLMIVRRLVAVVSAPPTCFYLICAVQCFPPGIFISHTISDFHQISWVLCSLHKVWVHCTEWGEVEYEYSEKLIPTSGLTLPKLVEPLWTDWTSPFTRQARRKWSAKVWSGTQRTW